MKEVGLPKSAKEMLGDLFNCRYLGISKDYADLTHENCVACGATDCSFKKGFGE